MIKKILQFSFLKNIKKIRPGSALILTMFIMAGMLIVAMSGAYVIFLGIRASGIQAQSTRAYYAAESGAERLLWELRKYGYNYNIEDLEEIFDETLPQTNGSGSRYKVYFISFPPLIFQSVGEFLGSRRSVEIRMGE